jgi:hypothetical protein
MPLPVARRPEGLGELPRPPEWNCGAQRREGWTGSLTGRGPAGSYPWSPVGWPARPSGSGGVLAQGSAAPGNPAQPGQDVYKY